MARTREADTILVVEDEADMRLLVGRVLELEGYRVLGVEDGDEGLRLARHQDIALLLLDLKLPGRSGWEVLEELKSDPMLSRIPVIVMTASAGINQRDKALDSGAINYLTKPFSIATLKKACADALSGES